MTEATILFFDTETTGLPGNWNSPPSDLDNWPRLVQLAWLLYDFDGNLISENCSIIKPEGFLIPSEASNIHKITTDIALSKGRNLKAVLEDFYRDVQNSDLLVAHNISYDQNIMGSEFIRNRFENIIELKKTFCTKEKSTDFCALPSPRGFGFKWPTLIELYTKLFNEQFREHDALEDIRATAKCFWELKRLQIFKLINQNPRNESVPNYKVSKLEEALRIASEIKDDEHRSMAYADLSKILIERGNKDQALKLASKITYSSSQSIAYADICSTLIMGGTKEEALRVRSYIQHPDEDTDSTILWAYWTIGEEKEALRIASQLNGSSNSSNYRVRRTLNYKRICKNLMERGEKDEALRIASEISLKGAPIEWDPLLIICKILMERGEKGETFKIVSKIKSKSLQREANCLIVKILMEQNKKEEALKIASQFEAAYSHICKTLMERGEKEEALKIASEISDISYKANSYSEIAKILMKYGEKDEALKIASEIINSEFGSEKEYAYRDICKTLMERGKKEEAIKIASEISDEHTKEETLLEIARILMKRGQKKEAYKISSNLDEKHKDEKTNYQISDVYENFSKILIDRGEKHEALSVVSKITDDTRKINTYHYIINLMINRGEKDEALRIASEINNNDNSDDYISYAYRRICTFIIGRDNIWSKGKIRSSFFPWD